ncbi:hypothetical protein KTG68_13865 [Acinetobacter variabilis]|uniref:hypothetical protein n=1 Tax=Acinetobacter variabilis TaxID=70346 RepID=UPI0021D367F6|nr:hypothetical protein [Acinetobacter variabilis]MCU4313051.1 hypothetical protein [Acinetobacter variabilis]
MKKFNIPLADQFLEIIKNYEIEDWEAKCFWAIIRQSDQLDSDTVKSLKEGMYAAIKLLSKNDYLVAQRSLFKKKSYLYSETQKLKELRKHLIENETKNPLNFKKDKINKELNSLMKEIEFINELSLSHPELCCSIKKYREEIDYQIDYCKVKIKTIDKIIKIHNR